MSRPIEDGLLIVASDAARHDRFCPTVGLASRSPGGFLARALSARAATACDRHPAVIFVIGGSDGCRTLGWPVVQGAHRKLFAHADDIRRTLTACDLPALVPGEALPADAARRIHDPLAASCRRFWSKTAVCSDAVRDVTAGTIAT